MRILQAFFLLPFLVGCSRSDAPAPAAASGSATTPAASASAAGSGEVVPASSNEPGEAPSGSAGAQAPQADPSRLVLEGRVIEGGLLRAKVEPGTKQIRFPGHRVMISDDGEFLIAFPREAPKQEKITLTFKDGAVLEHVFDVERRTYETDRVDGLPKDEVDLDAATKKKLFAANERIDAVRMHYTKSSCSRDAFVWPVKGKLTSRYGQPRILNGTDGGIHWGVDIAAATGTFVRAPACGKVVLVERDVPLSGNVIVIDHGNGLSSTYLHLNSFSVKMGADVKQGDVIATVGATGRANGPHLDWRMSLFEIRVDPELLAPPMNGP